MTTIEAGAVALPQEQETSGRLEEIAQRRQEIARHREEIKRRQDFIARSRKIMEEIEQNLTSSKPAPKKYFWQKVR